jgi:GT2 family glycosyltransferase
MIDDDEFPPPNWLLTLFRAIQTFDVDGVLGPVHPFFERRPPAWLMKGMFSGAPVYRTGTLLSWQQTYAGNALLKAKVCSTRQNPFDESFSIGGEDQVFFRDAMEAGFRCVAIEEAAIYEIVPPERWTKKYYLRRAIANGFNAHKADRSQGWSRARVMKPLKSLIAICVYAAILPIAFILSEYSFVRILEKGGHHLSRLLAIVHVQLLKERGF